MELKAGISLQTKQALSQMQVESLNILAMSMTELKDFLQKEEIENPLLEFSAERGEEAAPVTYKETERFYNGTERENSRENELYEIEDSEKSLEDLVNTQLQWEQIGETERKIVDFCIQSLRIFSDSGSGDRKTVKCSGRTGREGSVHAEGAGAAGTLCVRT